MKAFIASQLSGAQGMLSEMARDEPLAVAIASAAGACIECVKGGNKILLAGNGSSAADAQTVAGALVSRFALDRDALPAIALTTNTSILTGVGNDAGFDTVFSRQVQALGVPGDIFIGYSTSGQSPNILRAFETARRKGLVCIGLTGKRRGSMKALCDHLLEVPSLETPRIQEGHLVLGHVLSALIENALFAPPA